MLKAHVPAGIEAPLRFYLTEDADGTATLRYRPPSAVFKAYENTALDDMARELDIIFDKIVRQATGAAMSHGNPSVHAGRQLTQV